MGSFGEITPKLGGKWGFLVKWTQKWGENGDFWLNGAKNGGKMGILGEMDPKMVKIT